MKWCMFVALVLCGVFSVDAIMYTYMHVAERYTGVCVLRITDMRAGLSCTTNCDADTYNIICQFALCGPQYCVDTRDIYSKKSIEELCLSHGASIISKIEQPQHKDDIF